jgi:hypothetical protein
MSVRFLNAIQTTIASSLIKTDSNGIIVSAVAGTDYVIPSGSITGNAGSATVLQNARTLTIGNTGKTFNGSANVSWTLAEIGAYAATNPSGFITSSGSITGTSGGLLREDNRTISPSELTAGWLKFGFTSWANNNSSPYADFLHMRSYTDASGGSDNLVMFLKSGIGMRIWQQSWGSATAYSSYVDVWTTGNFSQTNVNNWNTAYGWGNHADAPYWNVSLTDPIQVESTDVTFQGNVTINGTLTENSSIRYKENIKSIGDSLLKVNKLNPVTYNKIGVVSEEIGLIAEDVFELFPEVVTLNDANQPDGIQYQRLSVILLKALQELTERVNKLENK